MRVLVVEDQPKMQDLLCQGLQEAGFAVDRAGDGPTALHEARQGGYDAVVLDVMLPGFDGFEVVSRLRAEDVWTPVLMLTARDSIGDRVAGLDAGADDYLVKPFALEELLARVRALLRRAQPDEEAGAELRYADLVLDPLGFEVHRGGRRIELTRTEFLLLELLMRHPRQVLPRSTIFENVWGYDFGPSTNSLEVYVSYLRRKLEADGESRLLQTVRGVGYVLREE